MRSYFYLVSLLLMGCAGLPTQSDSIHHALVTDLALRQATDVCLATDNDVNTEQAEPQRAVLAMVVLEQVQLDAEAQIATWFGRSQNLAYCQPLFALVRAGKLDLSNDEQQYRVLQKLVTQRHSVAADADLARSINSRYRKYGRSLYSVEKTLKESGCAQPHIALLRNAWPLEVYDALCSPDDYRLVKCEWGRCTINR